MKPVRIFRHVACEPPGYLGTLLEIHGCPYEVVCLDEGVDAPRDLDGVAGLVFMGGPGNVNEPPGWMRQELNLVREAADRGIPLLGICLGAQLISRALGGAVMPGATLEVGWHPVEQLAGSSAPGWFAGLPSCFEVFQWHAHTFSIPPGAVALLRGRCVEHQAFALDNILAMQFHLEISPESIRGLTQRYSSDLENVSDCVQSATAITADLEARTNCLYKIADRVFGRWIRTVSSLAYAHGGAYDHHDRSNKCPVGVLPDSPVDPSTTLNMEFGPGTSDLTRCISQRHDVKLLVQVNQYCAGALAADGSCARAYALHKIYNVIADYEVTYGMRPGKDYEIVAIVHSGGGPLVVKNGTTGDGVHVVKNEFQGQVQDLMNKGVKFYFCMNTTRGMQGKGLLPADATSALVTSMDGNGVEHSVGYVTAGITALADFQRRGYEYVQP